MQRESALGGVRCVCERGDDVWQWEAQRSSLMRMRMRMCCELESSIAIRGDQYTGSAVQCGGEDGFELNFALRLGGL